MRKNKSVRMLCIALILCLVGALFAGAIQSSLGRVAVQDITIVTGNGTLTGYLLIPKTATAESPAPAVVTSHGYLNNREMQDINYVELSRRGFVVFAMDAYGHGDSSLRSANANPDTAPANGMIEAVEYLAALPFVDAAKIGVTGHSMGGGYADYTLSYYSGLEKAALAAGKSAAEAHKLNKVAAGLIIGNAPSRLGTSSDMGGQAVEGDAPYLADVGCIIGRYDEFFISSVMGSFTQFLSSDVAKDYVARQTGDNAILSAAEVEEGRVYTNAQTGYTMVFWSPWEIHPWNHFSTKSAAHASDFFTRTLGAPNPIPPTNQTWWLKEVFNLIGLVGFFLLIVPVCDLLLKLPVFSPLAAAGPPAALPALERGKPRRKYITRNILLALISAILIVPLLLVGYALLISKTFPQDTTGGVMVWTLGSGLLTWWFIRIANGKLRGRGEELGFKLPWGKFFRTLGMAAAVVALVYCVAFAADYFFKSDFRIWSFAVRVFSANKIWVAVKYALPFLFFYCVNSLALSRNRFANWSARKQMLVSVGWNMLGVTLFTALQYLPCLITGATFFGPIMPGFLGSAMALVPILIFPFIPILGIAAALNVALFRRTGNIYLGGIINGLLIVMITVANTSFSFAY